ncbi:MAG: DsbA family protein [Geminicoccaceae bacterium]|nr:DsbA family protein [Geminicoccaceae bacterium]
MRRFAFVALVILLFAAAALESGAQERAGGSSSGASVATDLPAEAIEQIVKDYLLREPEVIMQALQRLQERQAEAEAAQAQAMLEAHADAIVDDPRDGVINPEGDVTLVEFFDYRCGYCRGMAAGLQKMVEEDPGLRLVLKEFPILGEDSLRAARAALAAKEQGAYAPFHDALMGAADMSMDGIRRLAERHGLDVARLEADMASPAIGQQIDDTLELGQALGITGTPSFILGERIIPGAAPLPQLAQMIEAERAAQ